MLCGVSLFLIFPANITFNVSEKKKKSKQVAKMMMRSLILCVITAVEVVIQKMKTPGFKLFIKNPEANIFAKSLFLNLNTCLPSSFTFTFLKNRKKIPIVIKKAEPAIPTSVL